MTDVLLVVDVQRKLVDTLDVSRRAEFLTTLRDLITRARRTATPVVFVRHNDAELRMHTPGWEIAAEIHPQPHEAIVDKRFRDAFRDTDLPDVVARLGVDRVTVCGMQTEFCIDATIREADRRGYRVQLVADGHATFPTALFTEAQIRDHVHRVAAGDVAEIVMAADLFCG